jgi:hypothetical protein
MSTGMVGVSSPEQGRFSLFWASFYGMERPTGTSACFARSAVISENRNQITAEALRLGADWVLYLDDDHVLKHDTLTKLLAADKDVISAHYTRRIPPFWPVIMDTELPDGTFLWKGLNPTDKGIISCAAVGAGALLVKRKVLEALKPPYWTLGQISPSSWGDDLHFCSRVRKAGFEIHCDLDNSLAHIMTGCVWPENDPDQGWIVNFASDPGKGPLVKWLMPLPGEK